MGERILTESRLKDARACQRLHHFRYELRYRPTEDIEALRFGTLMHRGLEAWWRAPKETRLDMALAALVGDADAYDLARAMELMRGYHYRWNEEPYEVLGVELEFSTELRNPETNRPSSTWTLGGRIDAVVRDLRDGRVLIVEHKTAAGDISQGSEYWRRLRMDGQISVYYTGARSLGFDVAGCLYDVLGKPGIRPLKATQFESRKFTKDGKLYASQRAEDETPEQFRGRLVEDIASDPSGYYQRGEVVRLESEMNEAMFDVWQLGKQIREAELAHRAPRNPDACVRYGRTCPFFVVCTGEASLDDPRLFTRSTTIHPELRSKEETSNDSHSSAA